MAELSLCATIGITPESLDKTWGKDDTLYFLTERGLASRTDINPEFLPEVFNVNAPSDGQLRIGGYIQPTDQACRLSETGPAVIRRSIFTDLTSSEQDPAATSVRPNQVWPMSERVARAAVSVEPGERYAYDNQWSLPLENGVTVNPTGVMDLQTPFDFTKPEDVEEFRAIIDEIKRIHKDFGNEGSDDVNLKGRVNAIPKGDIEKIDEALGVVESKVFSDTAKEYALATLAIFAAAAVFVDIYPAISERIKHLFRGGPRPPPGAPPVAPGGNRVGNGPSGGPSAPNVVKFEPVNLVVPITTAVETARQVLTTTSEVVADNAVPIVAVTGTAVALRWLAGRALVSGGMAMADSPVLPFGDIVGAVFLIGSVGYLAWNYDEIVGEGTVEPEA
ncbi:MAG: hypothetical protein A3G32_01910 [Deltaproteobacteria bacterium RIFCSPLOWO2_12_FULL_40_28]|nr:MAG: hypothetical protein A3C45_06655 [Deltaproteobacteria bacterium RIFCSPHIGHO2_02_FULL_40_28]OGQ18886.1 MAG: hypothetical protein A3E27_09290 [Deltaproteobacteria bacterium RIFCSPHIGHO2_12_FULL_40_32]OGQ40131.1 MAG: hypothetical protein A3I69_01820 [Deltaproteobacteria bacterium RIFCSPLOWO2_02_FULL_40_36]OGQ53314.1 MAG: hypothetical protein A3G32_01910 [Deltaproteobacteria bacterium RIFCSPLOWO2_12_FULL_40_28]